MKFSKDENLSKHTTLKVGGPAKFLCETKDEKEVMEAVEFAKKEKLPVFVLGGGSNILVSDKGFDGLVIKILNASCSIRNTRIECGAGCQLGAVVGESVKNGLTGFEWAAGIPGTVGGAIRGNAGAFGGEMADCVEAVKIIDIKSLKFMDYGLQECRFGYRDSLFKQNPDLVIVSAALKLEKGDKEESEKRVKEIIKQRKEAQPFDFPSSGSFFKNPKTENKKLAREFERDTGNKPKGGVIPAGYLIERVGLRGKRIGGAMVSQAHGNFFVNAGDATAEDFVILMAFVKTRIRNKFGIQLQEEVRLVGF